MAGPAPAATKGNRMSRLSVLTLALLAIAGQAFAAAPPLPDRSLLWRSEEALGSALPADLLENWPRDAAYGYDVDHTHMDLTVDPAVASIVAWSNLSVTITEPGLVQVPVDLDDQLTVSAATVDGVPAAFLQAPDQVLITLAAPPLVGAEMELRVDYSGTPLEIGNKSLRFRAHLGVPEVYSISTPYSTADQTVIPISHYWRACKDVPDDKCTFSCDLTIPDDMLGCSSGVMTGNVDNGNGTRTVSWLHDYPVSPYLVTIGVTNYQTIEETYTGSEGSAAVQHFVYPERYNMALESFNITVPAMEFLASVWGEYPYIGEKYGMFSTPSGPAVEEQTMTAYPFGFINGNHSYDWILVHELAHQWFGDCVTVADWSHVWLSEGSASYAEALWRENLYGAAAYRSYMNSMDTGPYAGTIVDPPYVWHAIVYDKGAWILHMLRGMMGDTDFFQAVLNFRNAHEYGNAVSDDFVAAAEAVYGGDMEWFFEPWLYHEGRPQYEFAWSANASPPYTLHLSVFQTQSLAYPTYSMPMQVEVTTTAGVEEHVIFDTERGQSFDIAVGAEPTLVRLDRWDWILADKTEVQTGLPGGHAGGAAFALEQNSPNPFNPKTAIRFSVAQPGRVALRVFDERGRMLRTLLNDRVAAGAHSVNWDGRDDLGNSLPSGIYLYRLVAPDGVEQRKMSLIR